PQQADGAGEAAPALGWQAWFPDPQLQALITQALANNRDLRAAALRVEEARALYGIQRADLFPAVGAQAGLDRSRTPADLNLTGRPL
ncbi:TolC family protein, partial [Acinetobacter baumannii]